MKHPNQPIEEDAHGVLRFKENKIVSKLLDVASAHGCGLDELHRMNFSREDWQQFNQLIGYSVSGYASLSCSSLDDTFVFDLMCEDPELTEEQARIQYLDGLIKRLRDALREPMAELFGLCPEDMEGGRG